MTRPLPQVTPGFHPISGRTPLRLHGHNLPRFRNPKSPTRPSLWKKLEASVIGTVSILQASYVFTKPLEFGMYYPGMQKTRVQDGTYRCICAGWDFRVDGSDCLHCMNTDGSLSSHASVPPHLPEHSSCFHVSQLPHPAAAVGTGCCRISVY
ncbi:hypothetical protein DFH08DRAFT_404367 [Mycena albidolilacea]|uniref:Uncharacterized protein n=1 Tax=Mycena albidolilacea TaxID=1033008 RepID=A0AAD7AHH5_9AGAR|nr:hypothetical protein DFH08DRAFT_404367 [Mycena albidolilacea]